MSVIPHLDKAQLSALLASRLCHDLISPVGAINNALELYDDDVAMQEEALQLMRTAAANACARLQFARLAFGASGSLDGEIGSDDVRDVAAGLMEHEKAQLIWQTQPLLLPKNEAKLLLNLLLVANATLPRGGTIEIVLEDREERARFTLICQGQVARLPEKFADLLAGSLSAAMIDAHNIQFYYTCLLAKLSKMKLDWRDEGERLFLTAYPQA